MFAAAAAVTATRWHKVLPHRRRMVSSMPPAARPAKQRPEVVLPAGGSELLLLQLDQRGVPQPQGRVQVNRRLFSRLQLGWAKWPMWNPGLIVSSIHITSLCRAAATDCCGASRLAEYLGWPLPSADRAAPCLFAQPRSSWLWRATTCRSPAAAPTTTSGWTRPATCGTCTMGQVWATECLATPIHMRTGEPAATAVPTAGHQPPPPPPSGCPPCCHALPSL